MRRSIALGSSNHVGRLGRPSLDFIGRELFEVRDARLEALDALTFADVARAAIVMVVSAAVARCPTTVTDARREVVVRRVTRSCLVAVPRGEVGRLMVLGVVVHFKQICNSLSLIQIQMQQI